MMRVYISSTYEDLKEYRDAVFAALQKSGLEVARMEDYTAADERPLELCLRDVAKSDIYVGLYAWRYGYEPPSGHEASEGKSITELEYRQAENAQLRKLLFFAHPDTRASWPDRFKDESTGAGERGQKLYRFRREVGTEKTVSFFRRPDELATLVLAAIMRSGITGRAYNIQPLPPGFVPRPKLAKAIVESLVGVGEISSGANTLVQGAGGFGKTTLAIDACYHAEVVNAFPDGMLWTSLGEKPELGMALSNLHVLATGSPPAVAGVEQISQALAKTLTQRRCLIVLDDVWRTDDLAPFLRLNGPRLLVTTRIRTLIEQTGQTWPEVAVDDMEAAEAAAILGRGLLPDNSTREALQRLAQQLGCWPLLLELANARLLEEQKTRRVDLGECIARVAALFERRGVLGFDRRESKARNTAVVRSVDVGLEFADNMFPGLSLKAAEISVFHQNMAIPTGVLADLWAMERSDVEEEVLRPLDNLSLLRWDREAGDIRLHMMIHRALAARLEQHPVDPSAVHRKLVSAWADAHHLPHAYAWRWFGWHCASANQVPRLQRLLLDFDWLQAKLDATDINALVREFDYIPMLDDYREADLGPALRLVRDALVLSGQVLTLDPTALPGQLVGRLMGNTDTRIKALVAGASKHLQGRSRFCPISGCLASPGSALLQILHGHEDAVTVVAAVPDGRRVLSGGNDGTLIVWDLATGKVLHRLKPHDLTISALEILPDGQRVLSASWDGALTIVDLGAAKVIERFELENLGTTRIALLRDGQRVLVGGVDGTVTIFDISGGTALGTLALNRGKVTALTASTDGSEALVGCDDGTFSRWSVSSGALLQTYEGHDLYVTGLAVLPDGIRAVSASADGTVKLWDLRLGTVLCTMDEHLEGVTALTLLPNSKQALSGSDDRMMILWDVTAGTALRTFEGHSNWVTALTILPGGRRAVSGSFDRSLYVWDLSAISQGFARPRPRLTAVTALGGRALCGAADGSLELRDLEQDTVQQMFEGHKKWINAVAVLPDMQHALTGSADGRLTLWDLKDGTMLQVYDNRRRGIRAMALLPERLVLVGRANGKLELWDLTAHTQLHELERSGPSVTALAAVPGRLRALSGSADGTLKFWDLRGPTLIWSVANRSEKVSAIAVSPDGDRALLGRRDGALHLWDLTAGTELRSFSSHRDWVTGLIVLPDGQRAISGSEDRTLKLWDLASGTLLSSFHDDAPITCLASTSNGQWVVSGNALGRLCTFRVD